MDECEVKPRRVVRIIAWHEDEDARRGRAIAAALVMGCLLMILLASFAPFHLIHDPRGIADHKRSFLHSWEMLHHHGNALPFILCHMTLNFFFYFPLGVLVSLALDHTAVRRRFSPWRYLASALGFLISLPIEVAQIYFVNRDPDLSDTLMNTLGYLAGYGLVVWLVRRREVNPARWVGAWVSGGRRGVARLLLLGYGLALLMLALLRLTQFIEISMTLLQAGLQPLYRLHGVIGQFAPWAPRRLIVMLLLAAALAPLGFLFRLAHDYWDGRRLLCLMLIGGIIVVGLEVGRGSFSGSASDLARLAAAMVGLLGGVGLAGRLEGRV